MTEKMAKVECGNCGWAANRKTGKLVDCPKCGECAGFVLSDEDREEIFSYHFPDAGKKV